MRTRLVLPPCLLAAYREIFPTLDFGQVSFWLIDEIGGLGVPPGTRGRTRNRLAGVDVEILRSAYDPCTNATFLLIMHELVHVLQRQTYGLFLDRVASVTCATLHGRGRSATENCIEAEAYAFAEGAWGAALSANQAPCRCTKLPTDSGAGPFFPTPNPSYFASFSPVPANLVMREAGCPPERCIGGNIAERAWGYIVLLSSYISAPFAIWKGEGSTADTLTTVGAIAGAVVGALAGAFLAVGTWVILGAMTGAIIGMLIGAFVLGLVGAIIDWIFGGGVEGGSLNVVFSTDGGKNFGSKATFERSREQPALAFATNPDRLFVGWTGIGGALNVFTAPNRTKATLEQGTPSGPALAWSDAALGRKLFLGWRGNGDHPNVLWSPDGVGFSGKFTTQGSGPLQSNIGLAAGNGTVYLAWVGGDDNRIRIIHLYPQDPILEIYGQITLQQKTGHMQTPALAFGKAPAGGQELWVAWSEFAPSRKLRLLHIPVAEDGQILPFDELSNTRVLDDFTKDTTGPALAIDRKNDRIYVAFTGADDGVWIVRSDNFGYDWPVRCRLPNELSRADAGPAIAVHPDGTVAVCWVGTDGD